MRLAVVSAVFLLMPLALLGAQERRVPSDSERITLTGCARNSVFTVRWRDDHEPVTGEVAEGRRFRLAGRKDVLKDVKLRQGNMVELTGLVRKDALSPQQGIAIGSRIRVGIGQPQQPMGSSMRSPDMYQPVLDVESYQLLPDACPEGASRR